MTRSILLFLFITFGLSGCADRKYEVVQNDGSRAHQVTAPGSDEDSYDTEKCTLRFKNSDLCLLWTWESLPTPQNPGVLTFKITRENLLDGTPIPVDISTLPAVVLWMPSMNHGSTPTQVEQVDTGSFRATHVFFIMPGEWDIRFQIKEGMQVQDEAVLTLII
ncbi:MAG: hypothetical protein M9899_10625 [Bdellovibrionaceae bacterium]|nr:hypothetical protein [Pseudobdellovibrionaceae bacterium]MCO5114610.1 hypothetical protein [Pseudobdellovibrionaceae bacterium]